MGPTVSRLFNGVILSRAAAGLACLAIAFAGSGLALEPPLSAHAGAPAPAPFSFGWTEKPGSPMPWNPTNWDVIVHSRDQQTWSQLDPVQAQHGADCGAPPATHVVTSYEDAVFVCNQHMMTAINAAGYGEIIFTPDHLADWTNQPVVIDWQQSTLRTSARDWTDVTITPFLDNLVLPAHTASPTYTEPTSGSDFRTRTYGGSTAPCPTWATRPDSSSGLTTATRPTRRANPHLGCSPARGIPGTGATSRSRAQSRSPC